MTKSENQISKDNLRQSLDVVWNDTFQDTCFSKRVLTYDFIIINHIYIGRCCEIDPTSPLRNIAYSHNRWKQSKRIEVQSHLKSAAAWIFEMRGERVQVVHRKFNHFVFLAFYDIDSRLCCFSKTLKHF